MPTRVPSGSSETAALHAGLVVAGKYELLSILGQGGMGSVWAATHLGLNQTVALKIVSQACADSDDARARFDREAKAIARLKSRYVVQVFDNGELPDGTPYMAMELLEGESLGQRLRLGPLSLSETASYVLQIARGLERAHSLGIVHRDIKPENIFLARSHDDESGLTVKVLDFGIAKVTSPDEAMSQTQTGEFMGTPLFMSPEQARGLKSLDFRTDLYSLGLVVYTMLSGQKVFECDSIADLMVKMFTQPLPSLAAHVRDGPPGLDAWFERACAREPEGRFADAREMAEAFALAAGVSGVTLRGQRDGVSLLSVTSPVGPDTSKHAPRRSRKSVWRSVAAWGGVLAVSVSLGAGIGVFFLARPQAATTPEIQSLPVSTVTAPAAAPSAADTTPPPPPPEVLSAATPTASTPTMPPPIPPKVSRPAPARKPAAATKAGTPDPHGVEVGF